MPDITYCTGRIVDYATLELDSECKDCKRYWHKYGFPNTKEGEWKSCGIPPSKSGKCKYKLP